ncbi:hypothetical protein QZH41_010050 [Actinostola sp. cb2023]|nr:hypothetical protein QZH41_010050 [Actinostola sp. cb2023]
MSLQSLTSELSSLSDDDVFHQNWNIRENALCRELGDGMSRSTSPYIKDSMKKHKNDNHSTMSVFLDEEGPVSMNLCNLCLGVSFFGEKLAAKALVSS